MLTCRGLSVCVVALFATLPVEAYQIATDLEGRMIRWAEPGELRFIAYLPENDSEALPCSNGLLEALRAAAASWSTVEGSAVEVRIDAASPGEPPPRAGYDRDDPSRNVNSILFETESWRHQPGAFAVTLRTYERTTGELLHVDIVFNAVQYRFAALDERTRRDPDGRGPVDVQGVATHELGHALGFEHARSNPSAMRSTIGYGDIWMRDLSATDREGLRFLYPADDGLQPSPERVSSRGTIFTQPGSSSQRHPWWLPRPRATERHTRTNGF